MGDLKKTKRWEDDEVTATCEWDFGDSKETILEHGNANTEEIIRGKACGKDTAISARVNGATYTIFKKICKAKGITPNACLNMLITDFVRENKNTIE